jgi:hypothetical protein
LRQNFDAKIVVFEEASKVIARTSSCVRFTCNVNNWWNSGVASIIPAVTEDDNLQKDLLARRHGSVELEEW